MENQHRLISGYRELSLEEIEFMNGIKAKAEEIGILVEKIELALGGQEEPEGVEVPPGMVAVSGEEYEAHRWIEIARGHLQQGFMALNRAVARPSGF